MVSASADLVKRLTSSIRTVPDFPKPGIMFRDITTVLKDGRLLTESVEAFAERYRTAGVDHVVGIESRGFVIGGALAVKLGCGFVPIRKKGKLPAPVNRAEYALEYGTDTIEVHKDAIRPGESVVLHDDLLATGGTMAAAIELVTGMGARIVGVCFLVELTFLQGAARLAPHEIFSLVRYDAE